LVLCSLWCFAQLAHLSCPILSTWSLQFRLRVLTHLATSITSHFALMSSLLIRSLKVTPFIFLLVDRIYSVHFSFGLFFDSLS
jgi:ABC-type glucose/galactose transport system permease subunit